VDTKRSWNGMHLELRTLCSPSTNPPEMRKTLALLNSKAYGRVSIKPVKIYTIHCAKLPNWRK